MIYPWLYSIGDNIGLFPVVYADRLRLATLLERVRPDQDRYILSQVQ